MTESNKLSSSAKTREDGSQAIQLLYGNEQVVIVRKADKTVVLIHYESLKQGNRVKWHETGQQVLDPDCKGKITTVKIRRRENGFIGVIGSSEGEIIGFSLFREEGLVNPKDKVSSFKSPRFKGKGAITTIHGWEIDEVTGLPKKLAIEINKDGAIRTFSIAFSNDIQGDMDKTYWEGLDARDKGNWK